MSSGSLLPGTNRIDVDRFPAAATIGLSLSALLWVVLLEGWLPFPGLDAVEAPMSAPGVPESIAIAHGVAGVSAYLLLWGTTVLAIVLPSMVPAIREFRRSQCRTLRYRVPPLVAFLAVYVLAWTTTGAVVLSAEHLVSIRDLAADHGRYLVGGTLLLAGSYQWTPLKRSLLRRCREFDHLPHRPRIVDGVRHGFTYAADCIAATWALVALLLVLGSTNPLVALALTLIIALERVGRDGESNALAVGFVLLAAGLLTLFGVGPFVG